MNQKKHPDNNLRKKIIVFIFIGLFIYLGIKDIKKSIFMKGKERVNVVFYNEKTFFYSFSKESSNYIIEFEPEKKSLIPGGYGYYRLGGLGKIVSLDRKPELFKKSFSILTSSMVDLYFYPCQAKIFYHSEKNNNYPQMLSPFLSCSNASIIDRLITWSYLLQNKNKVFYLDFKANKEGQLDDEDFFKKNLGIFYKTIYRKQKKDVQILYTKSYKTALKISQIIEGEGIKVSDIDMLDNFLLRNPNNNFKNLNYEKNCWIIENQKEPSLVAKNLISFFGCQFNYLNTNFIDTIFILGPKEEEWMI
jgi:hypothetical protein